MSAAAHTSLIKSFARQLGFEHCGIAKAEKLDADARRLEKWLQEGMQGDMHYMERYFDLRIDPQLLVPGARSVITLLKNYYPSQQQSPDSPKISKYAYGEDYHTIIKKQLKEFLFLIESQIGKVHGRGFVDSAPVLERSWAQKSGLGWVGKNGNLINRQAGSFFFIATLITDLPLQYDDAFAKDYCGTCTRCIDACPTAAILPDKVVDGSKCISYFTIELKEMLIPDAQQGKFDNWMFGCDTCQDVCPWNRFASPHEEPGFVPIPAILDFNTNDWEALTEATFLQLFGRSPLKRSKWAGIQRNLRFIKADGKD
jgi:epoxyqueuosine reductase